MTRKSRAQEKFPQGAGKIPTGVREIFLRGVREKFPHRIDNFKYIKIDREIVVTDVTASLHKSDLFGRPETRSWERNPVRRAFAVWSGKARSVPTGGLASARKAFVPVRSNPTNRSWCLHPACRAFKRFVCESSLEEPQSPIVHNKDMHTGSF